LAASRKKIKTSYSKLILLTLKFIVVMKKSIFTFIVCVLSTQLFYAQLKVASNGNVGVQVGTSMPLSALSIGAIGDVNTQAFIQGNTNGLIVKRIGTPNHWWQYSILGHTDLTEDYSVGIRGQAYYSEETGRGRAWGVFGLAGNSTSGYNYGVFGTTYGYECGAGIVGTINNNQDICVPGVYAGYFVGDVCVTGTLTGNPVVNSDKRYKRNIVELNTETKSTLNNVLQMIPVKYNLNQIYTKSKGDSTEVQQALYDEKSQVFQKKHYGLIAQDLQKLYPDLVYEDNNGYLSVDYIGIIPLLIESIKELNKEINTLKAKPDSFSNSVRVKSTLEITGIDVPTYPILEQNTPNPFNTTTTIGFYLPNTVNAATIYVYDMNGVQLKSYPITERGKGNVIIQGSEFIAGMYLYALIVDGEVIDTKRMILTK